MEKKAEIFAALGDPTRLSLVEKLTDKEPYSISSLSKDAEISRQAITKHLTVLEDVGLVSKLKQGRERLYVLNPKPIKALQEYLNIISKEWDSSLSRLKMFVENSK
ncbi:Putative transcriptional regulator, ArsR family [Leptospira biflexa serovar Patoc strain 'Patoc 1 (Paris)']|uniref:Putative transcriptional regulator, ArsR family n=2 Tax=Leptospira biflexa TaxID=172 RepID=B0SK16_LEPBP|nr:Putative transcriptional regulator, ArsR family [Leptospira biflexa serovar Patoc strain 'Patoc 1 (Paris)']